MLSSQQGRNGDNLWNKAIKSVGMHQTLLTCVYNINDGELSGRIYHCYSKEPWKFTNILQLIELADDFFDKLEFPQASTSARSFTSTQFSCVDRLDKVRSPEDFIENRGQKGTFFLNVRYRQNSSWQGIVRWIEGNSTQQFVSVLELLKILSNALT